MNTNASVQLQLVSQNDYESQTLAWQETVQSGESLNTYFRQGGQQSFGVYFNRADIETLISTVGIRTIKVRFALVNKQYFTIILFGANANNKTISAYYSGLPAYPNGQDDPCMEPVPDNLAINWIENWKSYTGNLTAALFEHDGSPLQGYTFGFRDFMNALFPTRQSFGYTYLCANFCLHKYYAPNATTPGDLTATFGLVLNGTDDTDGQVQPSNVLFEDFSAPCPPTC